MATVIKNYSLKTGIWKTIKNGIIVLAPSILAFAANLPDDVKVQYAMPLGFVLYFVKNLLENKN